MVVLKICRGGCGNKPAIWIDGGQYCRLNKQSIKKTKHSDTDGVYHRRRTKAEEKAKVVKSVSGEEFIKFLAALAVLPRTILNI